MKKTLIAAFASLALLAANAFADESHTSTKFQGPKANTGTVTHSGNVYLVDRAGRLAYSILANEQELLKYLKELAR